MKKVAKVLFDTWYGAAVACTTMGAVMMVGVLFSCWAEGEALATVFGMLWLLSVLMWAAAFLRSLWKRAWKRSAAQLGIGIAGAALFTAAGLGAMLGAETIADKAGPGPWMEIKEGKGAVPFAVEFRIAKPCPMFSCCMVAFDCRVVFASGKCIELPMHTNGFTLFALEDGSYALEDRIGGFLWVDLEAETVEECLEEEVKGRKLLGRFMPSRFVAAAPGTEK